LSEAARDNPLRFQGHYYDAEVKTYDMRARSYRPDLGRFLGQDRFESAQGDLRLQSDPLMQNRYVFASANPVENVEFDGHEPITSYNPRGRQKMRNRRGDCIRDCGKKFWSGRNVQPPTRRGAGGSNTYAPWRRQGRHVNAGWRRDPRPMHIGPGARVAYEGSCAWCAQADRGPSPLDPRGALRAARDYAGQGACELTFGLICFGDPDSLAAKAGRIAASVNPKGIGKRIIKEGGERVVKGKADDAGGRATNSRPRGSNPRTPEEIVQPGGRPIGQRGTTAGIREVASERELDDLFEHLRRHGTPTQSRYRVPATTCQEEGLSGGG
jgi:RHS repeat-associated protein